MNETKTSAFWFCADLELLKTVGNQSHTFEQFNNI